MNSADSSTLQDQHATEDGEISDALLQSLHNFPAPNANQLTVSHSATPPIPSTSTYSSGQPCAEGPGASVDMSQMTEALMKAQQTLESK